MRKYLTLFLALCMLMSLVGVSAFAEAQSFTPGEYTGTGKGNNGPIVLKVTFSETAIQKIEIVEQAETENLAKPVFETFPEIIIGNQSLNVDAVSGSTRSSEGFLEAVRDAVRQAGGDPDAMMAEIAGPEQTDEDRTAHTDILVIGGGGTGLTAALSAMYNGATDVILVEKMPSYGGSTAVSGLVVAANDTKLKKSLGFDVNDEQWLVNWKNASDSDIGVIGVDPGFPNYDRVKQYMVTIDETLDWFQYDLGAVEWTEYKFFPNTYWQVPTCIEDENGMQAADAGYKFTDILVSKLQEMGADLRSSTEGIALLTNEAGDVIGARVRDAYGEYDIYASRGVVLATGGFPLSQEMMDEYLPQFSKWLDLSVAGQGDTGDGMRMAMEVGAVMYDTPYVITLGSAGRYNELTPFVMSVNLFNRIVVDSQGNRFVCERKYPYEISVALSRLEDSIAWAIIDGDVRGAEILDGILDGVEVVKADSIEGLAEQMGVNPENLAATVAAYNSYCTGEAVDPLGNTPSADMVVDSGTYYAARIYVSTGGTIGGVKTDPSFRVLDAEGNVIKGLYAGGEVSNREMYAYAYQSGTGVGYALASGYTIGQTIMADAE